MTRLETIKTNMEENIKALTRLQEEQLKAYEEILNSNSLDEADEIIQECQYKFDFTTALKDNQLVLQKLLRTVHTENLQRILKFTEDDIDMLEDVIIENKQASEMVEMHRTILESMMDCMASIINNNLNLVMKFLAAITIIMSIPTMIGSFWGMNVPIPFGSNPLGFLFVITISVVATCIVAVFFNRKGMM